MDSRPLDLGAIFNRAIVLYARSFVAFVALAIVTIVPIAAVQFVVDLHEQPRLDASIALLQHPERLATEGVPMLSPGSLGLTLGSLLFGYTLLAFAVSAIGVGAARRYRGEAVGFRVCYAVVGARWSSILALVAAAVFVLLAAYAASILLAAIPVIAAAAFATTLLPLVAPLAVGVALLAVAFVLLALVVTTACALYGVVVEGCGAGASLRLTVRRILGRGELARALLCGVAVAAIGSLSFAVVDTLGFLELSRWPIAYVATDACVRALVTPFLALVLAVYYFDVRGRREASGDEPGLELAAEEGEPVYAPTAYLSGEERALVKRFLERRDAIAPQRRRAIGAELAGLARPRVPEELQRLDDEPLLERLG
ncbi:MAG TPA: hypothetical protein VFE16_02095 [Candidatus Cybelea sp.]|jgi:hypothetical protein|nr:hypothetical protein [Candidatus Cybelea sp.]